MNRFSFASETMKALRHYLASESDGEEDLYEIISALDGAYFGDVNLITFFYVRFLERLAAALTAMKVGGRHQEAEELMSRMLEDFEKCSGNEECILATAKKYHKELGRILRKLGY